MTADTGTEWALGVREPTNDPSSAAVPLGAAALFGAHFADQAAYAIVNAGCVGIESQSIPKLFTGTHNKLCGLKV